MTRRFKVIIFGLMLSLCVVFSVFPQLQKMMSVQVKEAQLRTTPSFLGKIVANVSYGDRVQIIQDQGNWKKVAAGAVQGWMHTAALTVKTIVLKAGGQDVRTSATGGELALAGKGFNEQVEKQYQNENPKIDYTWVNRMEKFEIPSEQMVAFLKQGNVVPAKGGAQ